LFDFGVAGTFVTWSVTDVHICTLLVLFCLDRA